MIAILRRSILHFVGICYIYTRALLLRLLSPAIGCSLLISWFYELRSGLGRLGNRLEVFVIVFGEKGNVAHLKRARFLLLDRVLTPDLVRGLLVNRCRVSASAGGTQWSIRVTRQPLGLQL